MGSRIRLKRGDRVRVIAGKDNGVEGEVIAVLPDRQRVVVRDVNVAIKAQRPTQENQQGGFDHREMPIHVSNVQIIDPETGDPSRIAVREENGIKRRISVKSGALLDEQE